MESIPELVDQIFRERIIRARKLTFEDKFFAGEELFHMACEITKGGIRSQNPEANEDEVYQLLLKRLAIRERLEELACPNAKLLSK